MSLATIDLKLLTTPQLKAIREILEYGRLATSSDDSELEQLRKENIELRRQLNKDVSFQEFFEAHYKKKPTPDRNREIVKQYLEELDKNREKRNI